jgi:multiple sugar transport system substrate-binding protein
MGRGDCKSIVFLITIKKGGGMKKIGIFLSIILVLFLVTGVGFSGCKATTAAETTAASGTAAAETTAASGTAAAETTAAAITPGTKISVFVDGGINSLPFKEFADQIKEESGIELVLTEVAQSDVYTKLQNDFVAGTGAFDLVVYFPGALPEFVNLGYLMAMDDYLGVRDPKLADIIDSYRELYCYYQDKLYSLPYDGDLHVYHYRKDLVQNPEEQKNFKEKYGYELAAPQTWDKAKDFVEFFTRKKGEMLAGEVLQNNFYGNGMLLGRGWCKFEWMDHFTAYGGTYFDENLNPMINSEAGVKALDEIKELVKYAPEGVLSWGYTEVLGSFLSGNIASMILWTGTFKNSYSADVSSVAGKVGHSHVPGSIINGELFFKATMPFGRVMSITSTSKHPAEAFWVASFMSEYASKSFTADPRTGEDAFRYSHVDDPENLAKYLSDFSKTEVSVEDCADYLQAIKDSLKNGYPDLSIPGSNEYMDVLDLNISKALAGELESKAALDIVAEEWNKISESLGFDTQKAIWQAQISTWKELGLIK